MARPGPGTTAGSAKVTTVYHNGMFHATNVVQPVSTSVYSDFWQVVVLPARRAGRTKRRVQRRNTMTKVVAICKFVPAAGTRPDSSQREEYYLNSIRLHRLSLMRGPLLK